VGKTLLAEALAAWCKAHGIDVGVMKPVASGGSLLTHRGLSRLVAADARRLAKAAGVRDPWPLINPVCYREPLAPYAAALRSRQPIVWSAVTRAFTTLGQRHRFMIVEGIGGLLVPLSRRRTVADLIRLVGLPVLIVSRLRLGTLNHTLLTVRQAHEEGLTVLGVVLNDTDAPSHEASARLAQRTNPAVLKTCLSVPLFGTLPHLIQHDHQPMASSALIPWVERALHPTLFRWLRTHG